MATYDFTLTFKLPLGAKAPEAHLDALHKAGCDDALIGVGRPGYIALDFNREAPAADIAVSTAIENVQSAIPGAALTKVRPDIEGALLP